MYETGNFNQRYGLTTILEGALGDLFCNEEVEVIPFGFERISQGNASLHSFIQTEESNYSYSSLMVKYAPDYILFKKSYPQALYFLELKVSKTPLYYENRIKEIRAAHARQNIKVSDISDIAREAWYSYKTLFPNTIILQACTYNPKLVLAQFVDKIQCLYCHVTSSEQSCDNCPIVNRSFFKFTRNSNSRGSKTPHTNLNLASFVGVEEFFGNLGISVNANAVQHLKAELMRVGVDRSNVDERQIQKILGILQEEGCTWIR